MSSSVPRDQAEKWILNLGHMDSFFSDNSALHQTLYIQGPAQRFQLQTNTKHVENNSLDK